MKYFVHEIESKFGKDQPFFIRCLQIKLARFFNQNSWRSRSFSHKVSNSYRTESRYTNPTPTSRPAPSFFIVIYCYNCFSNEIKIEENENSFAIPFSKSVNCEFLMGLPYYQLWNSDIGLLWLNIQILPPEGATQFNVCKTEFSLFFTGF